MEFFTPCILLSLPEFNLPLIGSFAWLTPPGPYSATTCRGRELNFGSHTYFFDQSRICKAFPDEWSAQCRGYLRDSTNMKDNTPGTHSFIPTRRTWNDDYDDQMIFGDLVGLKFTEVCLTGEENPRKNLIQETCPDWGLNPGPLRDRRAFYRLFHSGGPHIYY